MKKRLLTMMLSLFVATCLFPTVALAAEPTGNNVAEINGTKYETLKDAVEKAKEGDTITLLSDVTEDVKFNKNITVDGAGKYTISGLSTVQAGTLTNLTLRNLRICFGSLRHCMHPIDQRENHGHKYRSSNHGKSLVQRHVSSIFFHALSPYPFLRARYSFGEHPCVFLNI